jgi:hypothetical protein
MMLFEQIGRPLVKRRKKGSAAVEPVEFAHRAYDLRKAEPVTFFQPEIGTGRRRRETPHPITPKISASRGVGNDLARNSVTKWSINSGDSDHGRRSRTDQR